ncbi:hypothetical protein B9Q04_13565 [Candidatus Marsarchaeota G2 archaeon BE_D]|uniref:Uncharacterized protein n=1 Tax=Candidatus Marsarchaeota G2 archaeon BE_D TaxID=1978158 RepID=A0A2R6C7P3_9ARCH|nr:MAG: hypothetical protein B9Q04_13565 [Candidatus Marsarchaeota G2 archaeon BE_D]
MVSYPLLKEGAFCFFHQDLHYRVTLILVSTRVPALRGVSVFSCCKTSYSKTRQSLPRMRVAFRPFSLAVVP